MFPELPQDLAALSDEDLSALGDEFLETARKVKARDEETLGDLSAEQIIDEMTAGVAALEAIKAEQTARQQADENFDTTVDELAAKAGVSDPAPDPDPKPDDDEGDEAKATELSAENEEPQAEKKESAEAVLASARFVRRPLPKSRRHRPEPSMETSEGFLARRSAPEVGVEHMQQVGRRQIGALLNHAIKRGWYRHGDGYVVLASATYDYPEERRLDTQRGSAEFNMDKITAAIRETEQEGALVASGALCAPLTPIYDLPGISTAARPVRDGLASFQASRGGVIVGEAPTVGDYSGAITHVTAADNEEGGTFAVKDCLRISCPDFTEVQVDAVAACIEADNLAARSYPELMALIDEIVRAEQARVADSFLLSRMKTLSTSVTGDTGTGGTVSALFGTLITGAAQIRSTYRMPRGSRMRAFLPAWILDMLQLDIWRQAYDKFPRTQGEVEALFGQVGINASFYLDSSSTGSQIIAAQGAGAQVGFPAVAEVFLHPEGTFLHLDSGTLDLGIVRDSTLNSTNDFQIFAEGWENVAKVGPVAQVITQAVCPNGEIQVPIDLNITC